MDGINYKISERLNNMLESDKISDPQHMCEILKVELKPLIKSYIELQDDIKVRFKKVQDKNIFFIEFEAERIKPVGYIPL